MIDGQWKLTYPGMEYTFGTPDLPTFNRTTPDVGDVDIRVADVDRPRTDGRTFGVDFRSGRTISFDLGVRGRTEEDARRESALLTTAWRADPVRLTPGGVAELHARYAGRDRVAFGRPRRFSPNFSDVRVNGFVTVTADFAAIDDLFYAPDTETIQFGIVPPLGGGLLAPLASPLSTTMNSDRSQAIRVASEMPVWPVVEIHGPVANPVLTVVGTGGSGFTFDVRLTLLYDESITIDTRPWARSALRNGTANVAGAVRGTRLSKAALAAGSYEVGLKGNDPTGTARVRLSWRPTYASL
ncbi:hypothetical protein JOF56_003734 [Kibdelosporangium banguiense]|uniref:Minor tail protein n=1 Tax=Kibdelosporangium banguiense TaxID=1365924 RepID=A0ABS4TH77_9PSEU|nr:hypothetical protein [Kibdelosporangium banguiense]MBP2323349.1 hypothetical protein [Kibdelosporangium banguiense]